MEIYASRAKKMVQLFEDIKGNSSNEERFNDICSVRKGLKLVARAILIIEKVFLV